MEVNARGRGYEMGVAKQGKGMQAEYMVLKKGMGYLRFLDGWADIYKHKAHEPYDANQRQDAMF